MGWTFLTNHALVLSYIAQHPHVTARELSGAIGITERATRKIIADLDAAKYITRKREGRRVRYGIEPDLSLRHETQRHTAVSAFLEVLGWERSPKRG